MLIHDEHILRAVEGEEGEKPEYLTEQLVTYIGNKRSLLGFIAQGLSVVKRRLGREKLRIADLFSGSGVVSRYCKAHARTLVANDTERYCEIINRCHLANASSVDEAALAETCARIDAHAAANMTPGFLTELYAPADEANIRPDDRVFYTRRNAMYLDTARRAIELLPEDQRHFPLAPLLSQASMHANTSGVFKGFYKARSGVGQYGGDKRDALPRILRDIRLRPPVLSRFECEVAIHRRDANELANELPEMDVIYLDPPYNQHPYGSNYFMLNLVAEYRRPERVSRVSGIPVDWNRSRYNSKPRAAESLFGLIRDCNAKFLLISYNSEGFIGKDMFVETLKKLGRLSVLETPYNAFRGSRNLAARPMHVKEFLYLLERK